MSALTVSLGVARCVQTLMEVLSVLVWLDLHFIQTIKLVKVGGRHKSIQNRHLKHMIRVCIMHTMVVNECLHVLSACPYIDNNECADSNGGCGDICVNTQGSFYCDCREGFSLANDDESCTGNTYKRL